MAEIPVHLVEVTPRELPGMQDTRGESVRAMLANDHNLSFDKIRSITGYQVKANLSAKQLLESLQNLFTDPIIEHGSVNQSLLDDPNFFPTAPDAAIMVGFKPGVTDNAAQAALDGLTTLYPDQSKSANIATTMTFLFWGLPDNINLLNLANILHNPMIERAAMATPEHCAQEIWPQLPYPARPEVVFAPPTTIDLEVSDKELIRISEEGLLALNLEEMQAIQAHYRNSEIQSIRENLGLPPLAPTDVELECLAQTWSEHCSHKIFAAKIFHKDTITGEESEINSLFKTHIMQPTLDMQKEVDWLLSIFHDNSGVIEWTDDWSLCIKAETHNSPSALDPFGGAMTGIVGVNRDILGTGLGARPIANTDVFCFGPPDFAGELPGGLFHPSRVLRGVHAGIRAGGNESGIPTVNGAIVFDDRFIGKPLVYAGTVGIMPRYLPDGRESHDKTPSSGDIVYMLGGRVGSDGIHGATFSSLELTEESPSSAVQIGDPITQKKMLDMVLEARDQGLIQVITDNGAGGLSSSVGEMAELTGGAELDLAAVPLKQPGLSPWEILVSESQERMTVGITAANVAAFEKLASLHEVEATPVGSFTDSGAFIVKYGKQTVAHLPMNFMHDGCPQLQLQSEWTPPINEEPIFPDYDEKEMGLLLQKLLARPNIASKEWWVRQYDHEVIAQSVIKPFCGVNHDAPGDAAVIAPLHGETRGAVISCGIVPRYSDIDAYAMTAASIDEAVRNAVCVGVDLDKIAGLDNFCWPDPIESEKTPDGKYKLAQLVRSNRALDDVCRAYNLPCISGKDSMKNDAKLDGKKISIPPTLLYTILGDHQDVRKAVSSDFKEKGDIIYLLGETHQELGASELSFLLSEENDGGIGNSVPQIDTTRNLAMYRSLTSAMKSGLVRSAHDCSDGGLAVAIAECCFGCDGGTTINLDGLISTSVDVWGALFGESLGRIVVSVTPENVSKFESILNKHSFTKLGEVGDKKNLQFTVNNKPILKAKLSHLLDTWKNTLNMGGEQ
ncbi:MAG: phosphoribosylformylglycinamidine synthase subunit PurL [Candidatus Thalassarchaeaceae archaeon]|nr:phosphoribosylformylglycinamidine synthase subunit PurL [Candidatus Thalassarchaeaceae archaeon]